MAHPPRQATQPPPPHGLPTPQKRPHKMSTATVQSPQLRTGFTPQNRGGVVEKEVKREILPDWRSDQQLPLKNQPQAGRTPCALRLNGFGPRARGNGWPSRCVRRNLSAGFGWLAALFGQPLAITSSRPVLGQTWRWFAPMFGGRAAPATASGGICQPRWRGRCTAPQRILRTPRHRQLWGSSMRDHQTCRSETPFFERERPGETANVRLAVREA